MSFLITVPSKTFLLGEYVALKGGPAIILTTEQRFTLVVTNQISDSIKVEGINFESPAGKLIKRDVDFYRNYHIQFIDPYHSLGGFGASSAQFVMLKALKQYANNKKINDIDLLNDYMTLAWDGKGMPPSGADLIAQLHGGICFFHKSEKKLQIFSWPFINLQFCLIHTGNKLATHTHLKELVNFNETKLEKIVQAGLESLRNSNDKGMIEAIRNYANMLQSQGLVAEQTQILLDQLSLNSNILAAKGCGALGTDVIFMLFNKQKQDDVISWLKQKKFNVIVYGHEAAKGLDIHEFNV